MKIDFLLESLEQSGGRAVCFTYARYLKSVGHDVRILTCKPGSVNLSDFDIEIKTVDYGNVAEICDAELTLFNVHDFVGPLMQAGNTRPVLFCQGAIWEDRQKKFETAHRKSKKLFGWVHWTRRKNRHRRRLQAMTKAYSQPIPKIVVSKSLLDRVSSKFGGRIHLVPNGIDHKIFHPPPAAHIPGQTVRIISVGSSNLTVKRLPDLLRAVQQLKNDTSFEKQIHLVRISPDKMSPLEQRLAVTDEFHNTIPIDQLAQLYRSSDILVGASDTGEGFGLPPIEAMACGVPTVLTRIDAFLKYDSPPDYARFVDVGDVDDIAKSIRELSTDFDLRGKLINRGLEVSAKYNIEKSCKLFEETLLRIANS